MTKDVMPFLVHMADAMARIAEYIAGGEEAFAAQTIVQDAVIRNLEVIGEAAKRIPDQFRHAHPSVPWKRLAGMRDVLIHQYEGVDLGQVWRVSAAVLPSILIDLHRIVEQEAGL